MPYQSDIKLTKCFLHENGFCRYTNYLISCKQVTQRSPRSSLHHAAFSGHTEVVRLLVERAANVNAVDKRERRPLHWAAHEGGEEAVRLLVGAGAEVNASDKVCRTCDHVMGDLNSLTAQLPIQGHIFNNLQVFSHRLNQLNACVLWQL